MFATASSAHKLAKSPWCIVRGLSLLGWSIHINRRARLVGNMATTTDQLPIVLYHYHYSPYARRISWYLALRGIPYSQCVRSYPWRHTTPNLRTKHS
jgi:hypothetical protein